ncbi:hypothetical protein ASE22_25555 [Sphingomonas sp. Root720]|nr:hypothetical protein ASE22_25555 [Sphingomonas sp. Root720]
MGAQEAYDASEGDVFAAIRLAHPKGVDAVLDLVHGADDIARVTEILTPGARIVSALRAADEVWFKEHKIDAANIGGGANPKSSPAGLIELAQLVLSGVITPRITLIADLEDVPALTSGGTSRGSNGKVIIRLTS